MEEEEGLSRMIAQRSKRPSYARMISWEFKDTTETQVLPGQRRKRRRSKQKSGDAAPCDPSMYVEDDLGACGQDDLDLSVRSVMSHLSALSTTDSEEDEFFSAEEFLAESCDDVGSLRSQSISSEGQDGSGESGTTEDRSVSDEDTVFLDHSNNGSHTHDQHRRSLSKKQKRKRRKHFLVTYGDQIKPFKHLDICDDIVIPNEADTDGNSVSLLKDVPSLVQLCIKCAFRSKLQAQCQAQLPNPVKSLFNADIDFSLQKRQLSWLHSTLANFEPEETFKSNCMYEISIDHKGKYTKTVCELGRPLRNAWNSIYRVNHEPKDYKGSEASATLTFNSLCRVNKLRYQKGLATLCAVSSTLELMMPPFISGKAWKHQSSNENDRIVRVVRNVVQRLKIAMTTRFPTVVKRCFDDAVPYMFWARGDIDQAVDYFISLSQNTDSEYKEAMYLNEVGRLHACIGATETAARFYRLATDAVLKDGKNYTHTDEVTTQMLMLIANLYDQGVLTPSKGRQSADAWNTALNNRYTHKIDNLERHIMDMYLCCHCGASQEKEWLERAKTWLRDLSTSDFKLLYYLSMVHALLGEEKESHRVYWEYVQRYNNREDVTGIPAGREMVSISGKGAKFNPWHDLVAMVRQNPNVQFLSVVWRTQLQHLRLDSARNEYESDICSKTLDLHLDNSGNITGNMHMLLPPIRRIRLNPYTGAILFEQNNSPTKVLTAWDDHNGEIAQGTFLVPTLLEIYNNNGIKVHVILGKKGGANYKTDIKMLDYVDSAILVWTGPNGERANLNLMNVIREASIKEAKDAISSRYLQRYQRKEPWTGDAEKFLKACIEKRRVIDDSWITSQANGMYYKRRDHVKALIKFEEDEVKKFMQKKNKIPAKEIMENLLKKKPVLKLEYYAHHTPFLVNLCRVTVLESEKTLSFVVKTYQSKQRYLFVDITSKETFLQTPKMIQTYISSGSEEIDIANKVGHVIPGGKILPFISSPSVLAIFEQCGNITSTLNCNSHDVKNCESYRKPFVFGSQLVGISYNSRIWSWSKDKEQSEHDEFIGVRSLDLIGNVLVVHTGKGVGFTTVPRDLDHEYKPLPVTLTDQFRGMSVPLSEDGTMIYLQVENIRVMGTRKERRDEEEMYRAAISLDNTVVVLLVPSDVYQDRSAMAPVTILMAVKLPGFGANACFISQQAGVLLTWSHHHKDHEDYREHMFQVDYHGQLMGVLPFLGPGPHSLLPVYLPGDPDIQAKHPAHGQAGWYVFMRDGHDGIIGVKLLM